LRPEHFEKVAFVAVVHAVFKSVILGIRHASFNRVVAEPIWIHNIVVVLALCAHIIVCTSPARIITLCAFHKVEVEEVSLDAFLAEVVRPVVCVETRLCEAILKVLETAVALVGHEVISGAFKTSLGRFTRFAVLHEGRAFLASEVSGRACVCVDGCCS